MKFGSGESCSSLLRHDDSLCFKFSAANASYSRLYRRNKESRKLEQLLHYIRPLYHTIYGHFYISLLIIFFTFASWGLVVPNSLPICILNAGQKLRYQSFVPLTARVVTTRTELAVIRTKPKTVGVGFRKRGADLD